MFTLNVLFEPILCVSDFLFVSVADLYDDHALPATAAQSLLCKAARKRKEVRRSNFGTILGLLPSLEITSLTSLFNDA